MTDVSTTLTTAIAAEPRGLIGRLSYRLGGSDVKRAKEIERFLKFAVVGTIGAVIDLGVTNILLATLLRPANSADVGPERLAASIGFTLAVSSNFLWNRYWTYPDSRSRSLIWQLFQFFVVNVVGLGIRYLVLGLLEPPFGNVLSNAFHGLTSETIARLATNGAVIVALVIVMLWNFFINRYWTYNDVK